MAPNEHAAREPANTRSAARAARLAIYVAVGIALCVVIWALIEGGDRDLWNTPAARTLRAVTAKPSQ